MISEAFPTRTNRTFLKGSSAELRLRRTFYRHLTSAYYVFDNKRFDNLVEEWRNTQHLPLATTRRVQEAPWLMNTSECVCVTYFITLLVIKVFACQYQYSLVVM